MAIETDVTFIPEKIKDMDAEISMPAGARQDAVIIYIHGGGLICGNAVSSRGYASMLAGESKLPVYAFSYRLAPENKFPEAVDDCFAAYKAIQEKHPDKPVFLIGESGGAYLCFEKQFYYGTQDEPKWRQEMEVRISSVERQSVTLEWEPVVGAAIYRVYWSDTDTPAMRYKLMYEGDGCTYTLHKSTHVPQYLYGEAWMAERLLERSEKIKTKVFYHLDEQLEALNRGLIAVKTGDGIFLGWRMLKHEVSGYCATGMKGADYRVYKNGKPLALITDSTNYLDPEGRPEDFYQVAAVRDGAEEEACEAVRAWNSGADYLEIPLEIPQGGMTPAGERYTYSANDMSVGDIDGDGEYEYFVKWDPSNSHDVSHKGYTGNCYIDCYKLDGRLLWRLDMGANIRAGAHYTQFMVYDFDGDGRAEISVKTAPGTKITRYDESGRAVSERCITMPEADRRAGYAHTDHYACSAEEYYEYIVERFRTWRQHPEVKNGNWPDTLEECFGIQRRYEYPLSDREARELTDYFMDVYAPSRSERNDLRHFEGFIFRGPEYLTMFSGEGEELETIPFPIPREDDGLLWGDYAWKRIEPCNRVDRFLSCVGYLDGDGCHEIIYGAATIDHDGSLLYSSQDRMPDGELRRLGHGDAMQAARIDPDRPGMEIFNVFEGGEDVPYGYALRDGETGEVLFGERARGDLGRCMIGDVAAGVRGLQVWAVGVRDCRGNLLEAPVLGTNASIRWAADLTTQIIDGADYLNGEHRGMIVDNIHGIMLLPEGTATNNGTKGNPCLIADLFGDFREELVLRTKDSRAIRIYTNTELTGHKLFTLMHDTAYRCGVAWQNNCYNQPCYPAFYYGSDMDFRYVLPQLEGQETGRAEETFEGQKGVLKDRGLQW